MSDIDRIRSQLNSWITHNEPARDYAINVLVKASPIVLPNEYITLLRIADGGETFVGKRDSDDELYLVLWSSIDVLRNNAEYEVPSLAPSHFAFGTNGGGELLALDQRRGDDAVVMLPAIGLADDTGLLVAPTFSDFISMIAANSG